MVGIIMNMIDWGYCIRKIIHMCNYKHEYDSLLLDRTVTKEKIMFWGFWVKSFESYEWWWCYKNSIYYLWN